MNKTTKIAIGLGIALVFCIALIFARFSIPPVININGESNEVKNIVSSNGEAVVSAIPDTAVITLGVENQNRSLKKAYSDNQTKMNIILKELGKLGVDKKDIKTDQFNVNPTYDWSNNTSRLTGYQISNSVTVNVRKIDDTGKILESAVLNQANAIRGIGFKVADDSKAYQEALKQAMKNAEDKAKVLTGTSGEKKLTIVTIKENSTNNPEPINLEMKTLNEAKVRGAAISAGMQEIRASVSVDFRF